jgi:hypothetical protein
MHYTARIHIDTRRCNFRMVVCGKGLHKNGARSAPQNIAKSNLLPLFISVFINIHHSLFGYLSQTNRGFIEDANVSAFASCSFLKTTRRAGLVLVAVTVRAGNTTSPSGEYIPRRLALLRYEACPSATPPARCTYTDPV